MSNLPISYLPIHVGQYYQIDTRAEFYYFITSIDLETNEAVYYCAVVAFDSKSYNWIWTKGGAPLSAFANAGPQNVTHKFISSLDKKPLKQPVLNWVKID